MVEMPSLWDACPRGHLQAWSNWRSSWKDEKNDEKKEASRTCVLKCWMSLFYYVVINLFP